ncbi:MAG: type II secretion system protein N [Solidesulfovibrio sp.]|uniref:type II secretion system protein N n=1 Tax=Solidesulfovibrio sp. TaxID=2910990 RepID=UPI002B1EBB64|nr:type II secretion system protein N [Solidesulfovibrio sp.]MEA4858698.1 type II secretion system protein N [Solidesulfovibrio sp.]
MTETRFKQAVALVSALSLVGALGLLVRVFGFAPDVLSPRAALKPPAEPQPAAPPPQAAELSRAILNNDIFGLRPTPAESAKSTAPPKPTEIDMDLAGTVITADPAGNVAFLRDRSAKTQKPYNVGASVKDATIKSIGKNFVIFSRQGREEILSMKP